MNKIETTCGFVTLLGAPNSGKSTLVNAIVGAKVSIVSPKVQTTRSRVRGIFVQGNCEIVLVDTAGIFKPKRRLDRAMVASAWNESGGSDVRLVIVDSRKGIDENVQSILDCLEKTHQKAVLILNKIDIVQSEKLLELSSLLNKQDIFTKTFMVSAKTSQGLDDLKEYLISQMPKSPFMFPSDQISDLPNRLLAAEITREKLYINLNEELPYALTVETESWQEKENGSVRIDQVIYVERDNQRQIVLGKSGSMIKKIGMQSRIELEHLLEQRIHLFLFVKVREKWGDDPARYKEWGLDFNA